MMYLHCHSTLDGTEKLPVTGALPQTVKRIVTAHEKLGYRFPTNQELVFDFDTRQWTGELKARHQNDELRIQVIYE